MKIFKPGWKPRIDSPRLRLEVLKPTRKRLAELEDLLADREVRAEWVASGLWRKNILEKLAVDWPQGTRLWRGRRDKFYRVDLVMIEKETSRLIGHVPLSWNEKDLSLEVGYFLLKEKRKQGFASEAVQAVIDWSEKLPVSVVVYSWAAENNRPSRKLLKKLGFRASEKCKIDGREQRCYHLPPLA